MEKCIHRVFGPQRNNGRREFFNITRDQAAAIVELLTTVGVELVDPSEYNQSRTTSTRSNMNRSNSNISQEDKEWFTSLLENLITTDDRERVQTMSQNQQNAYLRNNPLNKIIVGLGGNLSDFKRSVDELDNISVTRYCNSLLQEVTNPYSCAFIRLIKYNYQ